MDSTVGALGSKLTFWRVCSLTTFAAKPRSHSYSSDLGDMKAVVGGDEIMTPLSCVVQRTLSSGFASTILELPNEYGVSTFVSMYIPCILPKELRQTA